MAGITKRLLAAGRKLREARVFAHAMQSTRHPILAQIIPIRRCNLSCAYRREFDVDSKPVPTEEMLRRIDLLADLGTSIITLSGGEPILHPDLDEITRRIRQREVMATLITNGYFRVPDRIRQLNRGPRLPADQHRQRAAGRSLEKRSRKLGPDRLQELTGGRWWG